MLFTFNIAQELPLTTMLPTTYWLETHFLKNVYIHRGKVNYCPHRYTMTHHYYHVLPDDIQHSAAALS